MAYKLRKERIAICDTLFSVSWECQLSKYDYRQINKGIPKGEVEERLFSDNLIHFLLRPSGESEDHTGGPRRLFA